MTSAAVETREPVKEQAAGAYLTQLQAARYLCVSVRWFRDNVHAQPVVMGMPRPGKRPVLRYRRTDLDAWVDRCSNFKLGKRQ